MDTKTAERLVRKHMAGKSPSIYDAVSAVLEAFSMGEVAGERAARTEQREAPLFAASPWERGER